MNTLKYSLEYHCYPIWNYDASGALVDNDLPDELRSDNELDSLLLKIQDLFDSLYVDTPKEFVFYGFQTERDRQEFLSLLFASVSIIQQRYGSNYHVECKYSENSFAIDSLA